MAKYEMKETTKNNLIEFLKRVDLKGAETPALNEILLVLQNPLKEEVKDATGKKEDKK
jgi:hypothetical protein